MNIKDLFFPRDYDQFLNYFGILYMTRINQVSAGLMA